MSRLVPAAAAVAALAVSPALAAAHGGSHTATRSYTAGGIQSVAGVTPHLYGQESMQNSSMQAVTVPTRLSDRFLRLTVADRTGLRIAAAAIQKADDGLSTPER